MAAERGAAILDIAARKHAEIIDGNAIDWDTYLKDDEKARVVPAETLAERGKAALLLGSDAEPGLTLPWPKSHGKVLMRPGKLIVWAGWSRHGKTQMLKQTMLHGIREGEKVLVASMEEEVLEVWKDLATIACGSQEPRPRDIDRFTDFIRSKLWLYDQQGAVDSKRIQAVIRYAAKELGVTHAVVDSLMMLKVPRDDYDAQHRFINELKTTAKDTQVCVHLVAHMRKRDGKGGEDAIGSIHDIAGGHEIGSIADSVLIPWRNLKNEGEVVLRSDKQRGRINWVGNIGLRFHAGSRQFVEDVHPMRFWDEPGQAF